MQYICMYIMEIILHYMYIIFALFNQEINLSKNQSVGTINLKKNCRSIKTYTAKLLFLLLNI